MFVFNDDYFRVSYVNQQPIKLSSLKIARVGRDFVFLQKSCQQRDQKHHLAGTVYFIKHTFE